MVVKKLASQTLIYGLSTIIPKVINYLLTPYLTYIALTEVDFGVIGYFYAAIPFAFSILLLGCENGFFRFTGKGESTHEKNQVYSTLWGFTALLATLFFTFVLLFRGALFDVTGGGYPPAIIPIVGGIITMDVISAIPFAKLREGQKAARFTIIKGLSVVINVLLVVFFYSILPELRSTELFSWMWIDNFGSGYFFISNLISSTIATIMAVVSVGSIKLSISRLLLRKVLLFSIPLFIGGLAGTANEFMDRFLIRYLLPENIALSQLGIYSATLKITAIMVIFTQMYRYAAEPLFLARLNKDEFKSNNSIVTMLYLLVSIIIFLGITLFIDLFQYLVAPEFRGALDTIPYLLMSSALMGLLLNLNFWYKFAEKTHFAIIITLIGFAVSISLNIWLIPTIGIMGAALTKLLSTIVMVVVSYYFNQKYYPINYNLWRMVEYISLAAIIFFFAKYCATSCDILNYLIRTILLTIFIIYAIKREKITLLLRKNN